MKKLVITNTFVFILGGIALSQPSLMYELHSLQAGLNNPMILSEYSVPGQSGADVIWDFRQLPEKEPFTGYLNNAASSEIGTVFIGANTELIEFDARFYFNVTNSQIEELGYSSYDGKSQTRYTSSFVKMKYPFHYGDFYSGSFSGETYYNGLSTGTVTGDYVVEADAYGALMLPGDRFIDNTLRVRSEKNYENNYGSSTQEVDIVTYRWYNMSHRYPLLVLTEYSVKSGGNTTVYHQAAYNNNAVLGLNPVFSEKVSVYPNPTGSQLILTLDGVTTGKVDIQIYDAAGSLARTIYLDAAQSGSAQFELTNYLAGLKPAGYLMVIKNGDTWYRKNFTLIE
jgi:hypothetical protein